MPLLRPLLLLAVLAGCGHQGTYTCVRYLAQVGEACDARVSCAEGSSCSDGICVAWADHGEGCDPDASLYCQAPYVCEAGTCAGPRVAMDEVCDPEAVDACADGLRCAFTVLFFRCLPPVGPGEACESDAQCPAGRLCVWGEGCAAPPGRGEPCSRQDHCAEGLTCVDGADGQQCQPLPRGEGDACGAEGCPEGLSCLFVTYAERQCVTDLPEGAECMGDGNGEPRCGAGMHCSLSTHRCERPAAMGEPCADETGACEDGLACQPDALDGAMRCLPPVGEGDSCLDGEVCGAGTYCDRDRDPPRFSTCLAPGC